MRENVESCLSRLSTAREAAQELADAVWAAVDRTDSEKLRRTTTIVVACNQAVDCLRETDRRLREAIDVESAQAEHAGIPEAVDLATSDTPRAAVSSQKTGGHLLTDDICCQRPRACLLEAQLIKSKTWKRIYIEVCRCLSDKDPERFQRLPGNHRFSPRRTGSRRRHFADDKSVVKGPVYVGGIWLDTSGSARSIVRRMIRLLDEFSVPNQSVRVFLKGEESEVHRLEEAIESGRALLPVTSVPTDGQPADLSPSDRDVLRGKLVGPDSAWNPYKENTFCWQAFERIKEQPCTRTELVTWLTRQRKDHSESAARSTVGVVTSPVRNISCRGRSGGEVRGSYSAQGHLYYVEPDEQGRLRAYRRQSELPRLTRSKRDGESLGHDVSSAKGKE